MNILSAFLTERLQEARDIWVAVVDISCWIGRGIRRDMQGFYGDFRRAANHVLSGSFTAWVAEKLGHGYDPNGSKLPGWEKKVPTASGNAKEVEWDEIEKRESVEFDGKKPKSNGHEYRKRTPGTHIPGDEIDF